MTSGVIAEVSELAERVGKFKRRGANKIVKNDRSAA